MKKMKAIVKVSPGKGLELQSVDVPSCGTNDVLIKVHRTAVCGTDLHIFNWDEWAQRTIRTPLIIGHEFVGEIVEMGLGVKGYSIGDRVMGEGHLTCGICRNCRAGKRHLCHRTVAIGIHRDGAKTFALLAWDNLHDKRSHQGNQQKRIPPPVVK